MGDQKKQLTRRRLSARPCAWLLVIGICLSLFAFSTGAAAQTPSFRYADVRLIPGGGAFGIKMTTDGVLIAGLGKVNTKDGDVCPAAKAGLQVGDIITAINGSRIEDIDAVKKQVEKGKAMKITVDRNGKFLTFELMPILSGADGSYHAGLWLKDSMAGIGTVTYIDPKNGDFGGLGHGICDPDTGKLMPIAKGTALKAKIGGVVTGKPGKPGELKGFFLPDRIGSVGDNTEWGVFGRLDASVSVPGVPVPVGSRYEIAEGKAILVCSPGTDDVEQFEVKIDHIDRAGTDNKNFTVTVTDNCLLKKTGGIVQGMSGSPILQNGKIVGAVTHVMIADPTVGYGIFIENMLDADGYVA